MCAVYKKHAKMAGTESSKLQEKKAIKVGTSNKFKRLPKKVNGDMKHHMHRPPIRILFDSMFLVYKICLFYVFWEIFP